MLHPRAEELLAGKTKAGQAPRFRNVIVEVTAKGKKFTGEVEAARRMLNPIRDEELKAKFRNNASYSPLKVEKVEECLKMLYKLEMIDDVTKLFNLLTVG